MPPAREIVPDAPSLRRPSRWRGAVGPLALAAVAGSLGWVAASSAQALAALELGPGGRERIPAVSVFVVVALASLLVLAPLAARLVGRPRAALVALSALAFAPLVVAVALVRLEVPIVSWWWGARVSGPGESFAPFFFAAGAAGAVISAGLGAAARRRLDRVLAVAAPVALGLGLALVAVAAARSLRAVEPSRFAASLELVGVVPASRHGELAWPDDDLDRYLDRIEAQSGLSVERVCHLGTSLDLVRAASCSVHVAVSGVEQVSAASFDVRPSSKLTLRRDAEHGFFVLDEDGRRRRALDAMGRPVDIAVRDVADRLGPPRAWIVVAALGLAVAALSLWLRHRARLAAAFVTGGASGSFDGARWIHLDGEAPLQSPEEAPPGAGPVVVIPFEPSRGSPGSVYRADASRRPAAVILGVKEDVVGELLDAARARAAVALTAVVLTSAPLVAALIRGLVL